MAEGIMVTGKGLFHLDVRTASVAREDEMLVLKSSKRFCAVLKGKALTCYSRPHGTHDCCEVKLRVQGQVLGRIGSAGRATRGTSLVGGIVETGEARIKVSRSMDLDNSRLQVILFNVLVNLCDYVNSNYNRSFDLERA